MTDDERRRARAEAQPKTRVVHEPTARERAQAAARLRARSENGRLSKAEVTALATQTVPPAYAPTGDVTWELQITGGQAFKVGSDGTRFDLGQWLGNNRVLFDGSMYEVDSHGNAVLLGHVGPPDEVHEPPPEPPPYEQPYFPPPPPPVYGYGPPPMAPDPNSQNPGLAAWIGQAAYEGTISANQAIAQGQNLAVGPINFEQGGAFYNELLGIG